MLEILTDSISSCCAAEHVGSLCETESHVWLDINIPGPKALNVLNICLCAYCSNRSLFTSFTLEFYILQHILSISKKKKSKIFLLVISGKSGSWLLTPEFRVFLAGSPSFINEETLYTESIIWICWIIVFPSRYIIGFVTKTFCKILHFLLSNLNFSKPTNLKWLEMRRITSMW